MVNSPFVKNAKVVPQFLADLVNKSLAFINLVGNTVGFNVLAAQLREFSRHLLKGDKVSTRLQVFA